MPLARIVTRTPETTIAAAEYLRSQGYIVETVSPGDFRVTPADFELNLEKCRPEEALARAKARLESPQAAVPAETGTVSAQPPEKAKVPIAYDIAGRPVEFAEEEEILPERRQRPNSFGSALVSMFVRAKQGISAGFTGAWQSVKKPVANFQRERAEQRALKLEAELAQEREEVRYEEELARDRLRQQTESQRQEAELAERRRQEQIATERDAEGRRIAAEVAAAEQRERQRLEAERAAALAAQEEQARIDAELRAAALRAEQEAAMAAEREAAEQQTPKLVPSEAVGHALPPAAEQAARQQRPRRRIQGPQPVPVRRRRGPIAISPTAVLTAIGASLLLLLGFIGYANRRPASPLSPGALMRNESVKQNAPFGTAVVTPTPAATPKPSAAVVAPANNSPAVRSTAQKPRSTRRTARRLRPASEDDSLAEDEVVVRHLQAPRPKPRSTASNAKLKQYSDTE